MKDLAVVNIIDADPFFGDFIARAGMAETRPFAVAINGHQDPHSHGFVVGAHHRALSGLGGVGCSASHCCMMRDYRVRLFRGGAGPCCAENEKQAANVMMTMIVHNCQKWSIIIVLPGMPSWILFAQLSPLLQAVSDQREVPAKDHEGKVFVIWFRKLTG
jgi:hypothetical protein